MEHIKITPELVKQIGEIDEFKGLWRGLEQHTTSLQMISDVAAYGQNLQKLLKPLQTRPVTPRMISLVHATSYHKRETVSPSGRGFKPEAKPLIIIDRDGIPAGFLETANPEQVEPLLTKLTEWLNETLERDDFHPLLAIAVFTAVFWQISPFEEKNIEIGAFLTLLLLMKCGYDYAPYAPLDDLIKSKAGTIYRALKHTQETVEAGKPDWSIWLGGFFGLLQAQKNVLQDRMDRVEDVAALPTLSGKIMKLFEAHDRLQMKEIIKLTNGRRSTVKLRLSELQESGHLKRYGNARSTYYAMM